MIKTILTSTALLATSALAQSIGSAIVVNACDYDVSLTNVPASGGGESQVGPNTLSSGGTYSQVYTELSNGDGWSIKMNPASSSGSSIMQYEYTFQNDGTIWFDLSDVNGDPWNGNWVITATGDCDPKQTAYMYSTDDQYGEQSCPDTAAITVTLCGLDGGSSTSSSDSDTSSAESSATSASSSKTTAAAYTYAGENAAADVSSATTLATAVKKGAHTVTNMHTVVVTTYVTADAQPTKRSEHLHRHMHHHNF